jgi:hypothetical protein
LLRNPNIVCAPSDRSRDACPGPNFRDFETRGRFGCDRVSCGRCRTLTLSCKELITQRAARVRFSSSALCRDCRVDCSNPSRRSQARQDTRTHILPGKMGLLLHITASRSNTVDTRVHLRKRRAVVLQKLLTGEKSSRTAGRGYESFYARYRRPAISNERSSSRRSPLICPKPVFRS